jgi:hypothetical protein
MDVSEKILSKDFDLLIGNFFYIKMHNGVFCFTDMNGNIIKKQNITDDNNDLCQSESDTMSRTNTDSEISNTSDQSQTSNITIKKNDIDGHRFLRKLISNNNKNTDDDKKDKVIILGNGYFQNDLLIIGGYHNEKIITKKYRLSNDEKVKNRWVIFQTNKLIKIKSDDGFINNLLHNNVNSVFKITFTSCGLDILLYKKEDFSNEIMINNKKLLLNSNNLSSKNKLIKNKKLSLSANNLSSDKKTIINEYIDNIFLPKTNYLFLSNTDFKFYNMKKIIAIYRKFINLRYKFRPTKNKNIDDGFIKMKRKGCELQKNINVYRQMINLKKTKAKDMQLHKCFFQLKKNACELQKYMNIYEYKM